MTAIGIGVAIFLIYVLLLASSSIGGYPNERLLYTLSNQINNNQSSSILILNKKGLDLMNSASYNQAITYFDKALAINPNDTDALNNKGLALAQLGKYNEAISYYDKALEIKPNYATAPNNKGAVLNDLKLVWGYNIL
jgi:tetratricopeptide (TPR) repeat protein